MKKLVLLLIVFLSAQVGICYERSEAFIIQSHDNYVKVLAPKENHAKQAVIVENKTLTRQLGRLETKSGKILAQYSVEPSGVQSKVVDFVEADGLVFIPLSPAFQSIVLKIGEASYEIPPKR